jgi:hypothetical protein
MIDYADEQIHGAVAVSNFMDKNGARHQKFHHKVTKGTKNTKKIDPCFAPVWRGPSCYFVFFVASW